MESFDTNLAVLFQWLLRATLHGSLLVCLILAVKLALRERLPARWHYCLWLILLVRLSLPWVPQSRLSIYNLLPRSLPSDDAVRAPADRISSGAVGTKLGISEQEEDTELALPAIESEAPRQEQGATAVPATPAPAVRQSRSAPAVGRRSFAESMIGAAPWLWLCGCLALGGYILLRAFGLWRAVTRERPVTDQQILDLLEDCKMQMQVRTLVGVVVTDRTRSPALFGFIRPRILLPDGLIETLSLDELHYVFLHELAHLRRRDIYLGWLVCLVQVLHWFNPVMWYAFRRMRADQEMAADALALSTAGTDESHRYGRTVVGLLERFSRPQYLPSLAGILENRSHIERRTTMIAKFKSNSYRWSPLALIMIIILACISLPDAKHIRASATTTSRSTGQPKFTKMQIPNTLPWDAQLSPDGKSIAFVSEKKIWIMPRSSRLGPGYPGVPRQLNTGDVPVDSAGFTWSGDGQWIAFTDSRVIKEEGREGNQSIYVVPATGGEPRKVHENNRHSLIVNYRMSLSPNGRTLAFSSFDAHNIYVETISVDGGSPKRLVNAPAREPVFSPDGQIVAYVENKKLGREGGGLWTVPADGGTPTLVADANNASSPVWSPDGRMIAFIDLGMGGQIYIVPVANDGTPGGAKFQVDLPEGTKEAIRLAGWTPDNKIGGVFEHKTEFGLYTQPAQGGKAAFLTVGGYPTQPRWFPDGKRVCHTNSIDESSGDWERYALAYVAAEGGEITTIPIKSKDKITIWGYGTGNRVSPDGTKIVFAGQAVQKNLNLNILNIWTLPIEGGEPKRLTDPPAGFTDWYPCWSPDGRNIAFVRQKISDVWAEPEDGNIYVVSSKGGEPRKITWESDRVYSAGPVVWSPSGEWLAFYSRDRDGGDGALCVTSPNGG